MNGNGQESRRSIWFDRILSVVGLLGVITPMLGGYIHSLEVRISDLEQSRASFEEMHKGMERRVEAAEMHSENVDRKIDVISQQVTRVLQMVCDMENKRRDDCFGR